MCYDPRFPWQHAEKILKDGTKIITSLHGHKFLIFWSELDGGWITRDLGFNETSYHFNKDFVPQAWMTLELYNKMGEVKTRDFLEMQAESKKQGYDLVGSTGCWIQEQVEF